MSDQPDRALREKAAEQRDNEAYERHRAAERRDHRAALRDEAAVARDSADDATEQTDAGQAATSRHHAAEDRHEANDDCHAGALERTDAERDRHSARRPTVRLTRAGPLDPRACTTRRASPRSYVAVDGMAVAAGVELSSAKPVSAVG